MNLENTSLHKKCPKKGCQSTSYKQKLLLGWSPEQIYGRIKNLQGEGLKKDEDEIKSINAKVLEKCSIKEEQKHNLDYTGAYQPQGLNAVNQNIIISQKTLKDAIANLSDYTKYFDHYYEDKDGPAKSSTPNPQTVLPSTSTTDNQVKFKNISEDIQNIINLPESNIYTDTVTVTFELAKNSFAGFKPGFLNQSSKSGNNNSKSKNTTLKKEEKKLSRVITETKLGKISNNSSQTILKHVKELNSNLDINKIKIESITNNSAEISSKYEINWKKYAPQLINRWLNSS
ncbi:hypothetical protein [Spiroplasma endosymbiont of Lonchoptera lutea]|uniref:hypothetical protein n=1 Tax=Spiroplasma endosymbiont of Lonchoptera lutea TaxID=3066297 RepID=UPI0030D3CD30